MSFISKTTSIVASAALMAGGLAFATPAQAAGAMTYEQWNASSGAVELHAKMDAADTLLAGLTGLVQTMQIDENSSAGNFTDNYTISSTKTAAQAHYSYVDNDTKDTNAFDYGFNNGTYLESIECFQSGPSWVNDVDATLARLGKPKATTVNDHSATKLSGLTDISPASNWATAPRNILGTMAGTSTVTYSDVTSAPDTNVPSSTVYSYTGFFVASSFAFNTSASFTFNAAGLLTKVNIEENSGVLYSLVMEQTIADASGLVLTFAAAKDTVDASALIAMGHKVDAEASLTKSANAIAAKAKKLAKAAGKAPAGVHLSTAAKALKVKFKAVKNGIKISAVKSKVTGNLCITAAGGKTKIASCN